MRVSVLIGSLVLVLTLIGCGPQSKNIPDNPQYILLPGQSKLVLVDDAGNDYTSIDIGRPATDYALAPNGKVYIPLEEEPGARESFVGIFDPKSLKFSKIRSSLVGLDLITVTNDGTAYIRSGMMTKQGALIQVIDTKTDSMVGTLTLPGAVHRCWHRRHLAVANEASYREDFRGEGIHWNPSPLFV